MQDPDNHSNTNPEKDPLKSTHIYFGPAHPPEPLSEIKDTSHYHYSTVEHRPHSHAEELALYRKMQQSEPAWHESGTPFALVAYTILSLVSVLSMGITVWRVMILLIIPLIAGIMTGFIRQRRSDMFIGSYLHTMEPPTGKRVEAGKLFWTSGFSVALPMALYTLINLLIVHARVGTSPSPADTFLVEVFVTLVHTCVAGVVGGLAGLVTANMIARSHWNLA